MTGWWTGSASARSPARAAWWRRAAWGWRWRSRRSPGTILGFAAAGLGVATLVPAAMHEADELPGLKPGTGLTVVSWLMRLGFLLSPPVVGAVADANGLRLGLVVVPIAGLLVVVTAGVLSRRNRPAAAVTPDG